MRDLIDGTLISLVYGTIWIPLIYDPTSTPRLLAAISGSLAFYLFIRRTDTTQRK